MIVPDLPEHGRDWRPPGTIGMQEYVSTFTTLLDAEADPVILVAHSRGGIAITQAAEERPQNIRRLVYLAAYLVPNGETLIPLALSDTDSLLTPEPSGPTNTPIRTTAANFGRIPRTYIELTEAILHAGGGRVAR